MKPRYLFLLLAGLLLSCQPEMTYDLIIRNGMIYDGSGEKPYSGDIAINADTIVVVGKIGHAHAKTEIDAKGMAISPGFINMLSWATVSLIADGRGMSDILQGVTLEVMGEGNSMGPLNESMKELLRSRQTDVEYEIDWTTLGEYLESLERRGVAPNVASFVGATGLRIHEIGFEDRPPTEEELERMKALVRQAMEEGAVGISTALIYAPAFYAQTDEILALCKEAAKYDGMYISHMRSEGNKLLEAIDELMYIAREADMDAEIYHLKAAGKSNWGKLDAVITKIDSARNAGLNITTDMYTYIAGATGLDASMPPWVQEGGYDEWAKRLQDPAIRARVKAEMESDTDEWENLYYSAGTTDNLLLVGFDNDSLKMYTGKTLTEVAKLHGKDPAETAMDLVIADGSRVGTAYFLMSEENVKRQIQLPYMSFGSDAGAPATEGHFLKYNSHPRAYGNFARLIGKYVRDEQVIPLEEAIYKLTQLSAEKLKIRKRGSLKTGYYADVLVFDPASVQDHSTFEQPHQYSTGMTHVFVNGTQVLKDGEHTGATPGRVVRGPGWTGHQN